MASTYTLPLFYCFAHYSASVADMSPHPVSAEHQSKFQAAGQSNKHVTQTMATPSRLFFLSFFLFPCLLRREPRLISWGDPNWSRTPKKDI